MRVRLNVTLPSYLCRGKVGLWDTWRLRLVSRRSFPNRFIRSCWSTIASPRISKLPITVTAIFQNDTLVSTFGTYNYETKFSKDWLTSIPEGQKGKGSRRISAHSHRRRAGLLSAHNIQRVPSILPGLEHRVLVAAWNFIHNRCIAGRYIDQFPARVWYSTMQRGSSFMYSWLSSFRWLPSASPRCIGQAFCRRRTEDRIHRQDP